MSSEIIGYIAGTLTTLCFVPQAWKVLRDHNLSGISFTMYIMFATGVFCWLIYGLAINNTPIIFFNSVTLVLTLVIIHKIYKLKNDV